MSDITFPSEKERMIENGEYDWSYTLKDHGAFIVIMMFMGPLTVAHELLAYSMAGGSEFEHLRVDFERIGKVWAANGVFWWLLIALMIII